MLASKILSKKRSLTKTAREIITDLIYSTFKFPESNANSGLAAVGDNEEMRPDLVANRIYGDQSKWDVLLKYNGISNPFSINVGDLLYALPFGTIDTAYKSPRIIEERTQLNDVVRDLKVSPKDKNRLNNLADKKAITTGKDGKLPPNINKAGDKNVKIKDGKLILGEDVTSVNKENCPIPISRARLQTALLKDKLFL